MVIDAIVDWNDFLLTETRQNVMAVAQPSDPFEKFQQDWEKYVMTLRF